MSSKRIFRLYPLLPVLLLAFLPLCAGCTGFAQRPQAAADQAAPEGAITGNSRSYYFFTVGLLLEEQGKQAEAAEALKRALDADPGSVYLMTELAKLYLQIGEIDKARPLCIDIVAASPDDPKAYLLLGALEAMGKQTTAAIAAYEKAISLSPEREDITFVLGDLYFQAEQYKKALSLYEKLIKENPESFQAWFFLGEARDRLKMPDEAVAAFTKAAEINPDLDQARFEIIRIYMEKGRKNDVVKAFKEMMKGPAVKVKAILGLAAFYLKEKDLEDAKKTFELLDDEVKKDPSLLQQVGAYYYDAKYYDEAEKVFAKLAEQGDDSGSTLYLLGLSQEAGGKKDQAVETYRKVPPSSGSYDSALLRVAQTTGAKADQEAALAAITEDVEQGTASAENVSVLASLMTDPEMLRKVEKLITDTMEENPDDDTLLFSLGVVQDKLGEKQKCIETMKKVLEMAPDDPVPLNYLGYTYADMGIELDQAEILVQKALSLRPGDGFIMDSLAWVYFKKGETQKALDLLLQATALVPEEPVVLEHLGDVYEKSGQVEKAREAYQKSVLLQKDPVQRKAVEEKLSKLAK